MALNYPFVYRIFSWCAKGIVIKNNALSKMNMTLFFGGVSFEIHISVSDILQKTSSYKGAAIIEDIHSKSDGKLLFEYVSSIEKTLHIKET